MSARFCPKCGRKHELNSKFCAGCGTRLGDDQPPASPPPSQGAGSLAEASAAVSQVGSAIHQVSSALEQAAQIASMTVSASPPPKWTVVVGEALPPVADVLARAAAGQMAQAAVQKVTEAVQAHAAPPAAPPARTAPARQEQGGFCAACGAALARGAKFCAHCGARSSCNVL